MRDLTLLELYLHPITQKFVIRSGLDHAISVAYAAFELATKREVNTDMATKAAFLHDIGHYTWLKEDGVWDYELYRSNDVHPIKGAERAHKLLIRLGEDPVRAKQIALAILFHTDSCIPEGKFTRSPLQQVIKDADEIDEEKGGTHHNRKIEAVEARKKIEQLDLWVELGKNP